mgnify:CR=1 FL=1
MKPSAFQQFAELEREHWWFRGRRSVYLELLRGALRSKQVGRVLDVGTGIGGFLESLQELGGPLYFTERDQQAASLASTRSGKHGVRALAEQLPFASESFDLVCMFDVIEHVEEHQQVLQECLRILSPGGLLALSVPAHPWLFSRNDEVAGHVRRYRRADLKREVCKAGFRLRRCTFANVLLFPLIVVAVLSSKALCRVFPAALSPEHTNLSWRLPAWLQRGLHGVFQSELVLSRHMDLPLGHSLLLIAEKAPQT